MKKKVCIIIGLLLGGIQISLSQTDTQTIRGIVLDSESGKPIEGAAVFVIGSDPPAGTATDADGKFHLAVTYGRISLRVSFMGYENLILANLVVTSGRQPEITAGLREKVIRTEEIVVKGSQGEHSVNPMAAISIHTLRPEDAMHYAGGFYDPSRMVNAFAGVVTSNNDYSNEIVIRGNSSRGLLWRLEGIEIPNPNHFSDGKGGSGGAFSSITSNVIDNFDFFTGAFPAEYGNAFSGVMDINLRKGNTEKHEFAFQTGMIGAEVAAEGPLSGRNSSYLLNARFTNFKILNDMNLIDLGETNYAPRTRDVVININTSAGKAGYLNLFGVYGASELGKEASDDISSWHSTADQWEEREEQNSLTAGLKNLIILSGSSTYIRTVAAFTTLTNRYNEGYVDSSLVRNDSYFYDYTFPALRFSSVINHKINAANSVRGGIFYNHLSASMANIRLNNSGQPDTLVLPSAEGSLFQSFLQWKKRIGNDLEINPGFHILGFSINHQISFEPRFGIRWQYMPGKSFVGGAGFHSRTESLAVYYSNIKTSAGRAPVNSDMGLSKAFHLAGGVEMSLRKDLSFRLEGYYQKLYDIPYEDQTGSRYSTINSSEGLPDALLVNKGKGFNRGTEITLEKTFTDSYFFLVTGSLFNSMYKAGDGKWYNTYYNTRFVSNILTGKDFRVGRGKKNTIGLNTKLLLRGGYRYTAPDVAASLRSKKIVNDRNRTYASQLPVFLRMDAGINFRRNKPGYSWVFMLDIQNATNRKNVFKKRFSYEKGQIITYNVYSMGIVPVFNFRIEF
jgi:hypothetical protein